MANPQKENGYTAIANEIMEALYRMKLSGHELRLTLLVLRKTYGFQKKEDAISLSQMEHETGIHHIRCSQVIKRLQLANILTVSENINGIRKKYIFNKDFEKWIGVSESTNRYKKKKYTLSEKRNIPLVKNASTKEILQKKYYKRNIYCEDTQIILAYLNEKTSRTYKDASLIEARIKDGGTVEECKRIIDTKLVDPYFLANPKYLSPATLFRKSHWDIYLNEGIKPEGSKSKWFD